MSRISEKQSPNSFFTNLFPKLTICFVTALSIIIIFNLFDQCRNPDIFSWKEIKLDPWVGVPRPKPFLIQENVYLHAHRDKM